MARNNREIDRKQKQESIITAAQHLFMRHGYDNTSMSAIANAAGVAPNTLYWYFKNKDDVFIEVLNRAILHGVTVFTTIDPKQTTERIFSLFAQLEQAHHLITAVHTRLEQSEIICTWHNQFHLLLGEFLIDWLTDQGFTKSKASTIATVGTFIIEGLLSHPHTSSQKEQVLNWLIEVLSQSKQMKATTQPFA